MNRMKRRTRAAIATTAFFYASLSTFVVHTVAVESAAAQESPYLTGNLTPGSYGVGFKVYHEYDYSRTYAPGYNENAETLKSTSPRPMQIAIWYPTVRVSGQTFMEYRDYTYLDATAENFETVLDESALAQLDQNFQYQAIFTGTANPDILHAVLSETTTAIRDAGPANGRFPLVIYSPREFRGAYYNSQLIEYLVSHGFVVATTPNKDRLSATRQSPTSADMILTNMRDLQFVKGFASQFDFVDTDKIGVAGWAYGAVPALSLAMSDINISAVLSIDGNIRFPGARAQAALVPIFAPTALYAPIMHIETVDPQFGGAPPVEDYTFHDAVTYADAYHLRMRDAAWFGMSSSFNIVHGKGANDPTRFDYEAIDRSYDELSLYALNFLNAYLKDDASGRAFLSHSPEDNGIPEGSITLKSKQGLTPPPTEPFFVQYFLNEGSEKALALWDRTTEEDSTYLIASANGLNALGYQLIGSGDTEEAVVALKLQTDTYPWMANAWDSMGEGYMANGDDDLAIEAFQTSLTLNPAQNVMDNSISLLGQLGFDYVAPEFVDLSERDLLGLSGTYENAQNSPATITVVTVEDGTLKAQQPGQPEFDLLPQSETLFWASSAGSRAGVTVEFVKGDSGVAAEMLFTFPNSATPVTALRQSESGTN